MRSSTALISENDLLTKQLKAGNPLPLGPGTRKIAAKERRAELPKPGDVMPPVPKPAITITGGPKCHKAHMLQIQERIALDNIRAKTAREKAQA